MCVFARRIERRREHGYTRIELTFYGPDLLELEEYAERMDETRELLTHSSAHLRNSGKNVQNAFRRWLQYTSREKRAELARAYLHIAIGGTL